jgi:hypothetical protein
MISYGSASLQGWGMVELAAGRVRNPNTRVGLAASIVGNSIGLAASFGQLTGYIWIWQFRWCATVYAFTVCAWAESILTMPVGTYRLQIFLHSIPMEYHFSRFKRCGTDPNLLNRGHTIAYSDPPCPLGILCCGSSCVHFGKTPLLTH